MKLRLVGGSANPELTARVSVELGCPELPRVVERFPDGELHLELRASVRGDDVFVLQPVGPPVDESLVELLLMGDAIRRAGAGRITAVVPYLGYARQERRARGREPIASRLVADLIGLSGFERIVTVDPHSQALEGFFGIPVEPLTAAPMLAQAVRNSTSPNSVIVAPDLGAVKLADRYASELGLPMAVVHKLRLSSEDVKVNRITGQVRGRAPVIVDDMISTAGTVRAATWALMAEGCLPEVQVLATHGPLAPGLARERLLELPLVSLWTTDTLALPEVMKKQSVQLVSVAPLIARAITALYSNESLAQLLAHR